MDCYGGGGYNCIYICTADPTVNANYSILARANSSYATTCEAVVQITVNPTYIMCGSSNNALGFNMTDPFFTIEMLATTASINQQNFYLNSIAGASDSTVGQGSAGPPQSSQVLAYNGSSWTNTTLALPSAVSFI